jgi:peptidoglycan LD-endopeptidase LytH
MGKQTWMTGLTLALCIAGAGQAKAHEKTYTVQAGDSLWKIAVANQITVQDLKSWNHLIDDRIYVGQTLSLLPPHTHEITYTVKAGDTLSLIAKNHNVLIADIKIKNQLTSDYIRVGQTLVIPTEQGTYATHTVKAGETLSIIARDYGISLLDLKSWNNLTSDLIYVNQTLYVSNPTSSHTNPDHTSTAPQANSEAIVHIVQPGDTLYGIALKYGTTVSKIKEINNLTSDIIYVGQPLKVTDGALPAPTAPEHLKDGVFPLKAGTYKPFGDTYGDSRLYGGDRVHEGTDIMAAKGTPIYSATDGVIIRKGWSELGGWRLTVKTSEGIYIYYAHMQGYAANIAEGQTIKKGQLIGYVGDSGYGPVGTTGKFTPHLHFGMYDANWNAINPYTYLKYWEWKMNQ